MLRLSAFADEIAADVEKQVEILLREDIHFVEFRSAWGVNVLDLTDRQVAEVRRIFGDQGVRIAVLGSPIGKVAISEPFPETLQRFARALEVAHALDTSLIRMFSFYAPLGSAANLDPATWRDEVIVRVKELTRLARAEGVTLLHENERAIYGDTIARNVDLLQSVNDAHFRSVLDPANYLHCSQIAYPDAYEATRPWLDHVHVKDMRADGTLVVAGAGESRWPELLQRLRANGYDGFLTLEPHLAMAGQSHGYSGPELFQQAAQALKGLLTTMDWAYA